MPTPVLSGVLSGKEPNFMEVNLTPTPKKKLRDFAAHSGRPTDELVEDAVAGYFDDVLEVRRHIDEGYSQAERGELIDGDLARREIQAMKSTWRRRAPVR